MGGILHSGGPAALAAGGSAGVRRRGPTGACSQMITPQHERVRVLGELFTSMGTTTILWAYSDASRDAEMPIQMAAASSHAPSLFFSTYEGWERMHHRLN